ncbi:MULTISPECIES: ORF6N domain-containing protein [unclassified Clostridium]|uniref:ORF6N domain-containing protein n=1 Tax=unclassified Clostridium TaxID=2614128 RepID=UPI002079A24C|nr:MULTISPECIES: ORF6N domain-containing protein [unclassified Clostridium]
MKKKTINLVVKGEIDFNGISIKQIEGGFNETGKVILAKDVALIHDVELRKINELIKNNIDEFDEGIDILDLKHNKDFAILAKDSGLYTTNALNASSNIYLLSEQGYLALACLMRTTKAKEIRKQFRRDYFRLKEENQKLKKYARSNNRFTTGCLFNLEGKKETDTDFEFLINNAVRNEVLSCYLPSFSLCSIVTV